MAKKETVFKALAIANICLAVFVLAGLILFAVNGTAALYGAFNKEATSAISSAEHIASRTIVALFFVTICLYGATGLLGVFSKYRLCIVFGAAMSLFTGLAAFRSGSIEPVPLIIFFVEEAYAILAVSIIQEKAKNNTGS